MNVGVAKPATHLTSGRLLARNTVWNLLSQFLPMAVGVVAVPPLVRGLGVERFGVLSLAWIVIGYFSLFDLGIGRALTKLVADKLGAGEHYDIPALVWTSLALMLGLGAVGALVAVTLSPLLVQRVLKISVALQPETLRTFYWLALSIPVITVTSGLRGILEAQQRFAILTFIRIPLSVFSFVGPLLVLPFSKSMVPMVIVLLAGRLVGTAAHFFACMHSMPALRHEFELERSIVSSVLKFGGWMTVTNVVGPVMVYMDRFLVGSLLSVSAIAYYTAPFDMVTRLLLIPTGLTGVLFPALAVSLAQKSERTTLLLNRSEKYIVVVIFPVVLAIVVLAPEGLRLWLGETFARNGASVLRWLAAGVFINSVAQVPFVLIQSAGKPDLTARLHMVELPLYLAAVWVLTRRMGIEGTAIAWTARIAVDSLALIIFSHRVYARSAKVMSKIVALLAGGLLLLFLGTLITGLLAKTVFLAAVLAAFGLITWFLVLDPSERAFLFRRLNFQEDSVGPAS